MNSIINDPSLIVWAVSAILLFITGLPVYAQTGSANAPIAFYAALGEDCWRGPHPVHGIGTRDGGVVLVGKSITSGGWGGFAVKVGPPNRWGWGS